MCYIEGVMDTALEIQAAALRVPATPAYVYSETALRSAASDARKVADAAGCGLLYTLKACGLAGVLRTLAPYLDGFAASSAFEARAADSVRMPSQTIHCYSPAFGADEMLDVTAVADYLSLNSAAQLDLAASNGAYSDLSVGLRVNPGVSLVSESRYDPCRPYSKLGASLDDLNALPPGEIEGVHVHNNCESDDLTGIETTFDAIAPALRQLPDLRWVNLGGGYYFDRDTDAAPLARVANRVKTEFGAETFVEPGTSLVQRAGMLVTEVLDVFERDGADVAILDASTSHMPEVFEYGFAPRVYHESGAYAKTGDRSDGCAAILAGRSCLAGDVFGEYVLAERPRAGDRVAILDAGSYSHARASAFNGIPIPSAYLMRDDGGFKLMSEYGYGEFAARNGAKSLHYPNPTLRFNAKARRREGAKQ